MKFFLMFSSNVCCFAKGSQVNKVLFVMGSMGTWRSTAFVILNSAEDVDKAVSKNDRLIAKNSVKGNCPVHVICS